MVVREIYPSRRETLDRSTRVQRRGPEGLRAAGEGRSTSLAGLWRHKLTVLAGLFLCLGAGVAYLAVVPARFLSSSALLIDPHLGKGIGTDANQPGFVTDASAIDSQVKLLTSQTVLERVAAMTNLDEDPEFNGSQRSRLLSLFKPAPVAGKVDLKALEDAIAIKRPERTYVVEVDVLARDAQKAAAIANAVAQAYTADQISARLDAAAGDSKFVDERLKTLQQDIRSAETKLEAFKTRNTIVTTTGLRSNEQQISDLTKVLGDARAKTSDAKARAGEIDGMAEAGHLDASNAALSSVTMERLRQSQAEAERDAARIATTLGDRHPALQEAKSQVAKINGLIRAELQRLKRGAMADYRTARHSESGLAAEVDRLKSQSVKISATLVPLSDLERNVQVLQASYDRFARIKDTVSQQEADSPPARVIAVARPAVSAASPKKSLVLLVAGASGLFLGIAAALLRDGASQAAARTVAEPDEREEPDAAPPYGHQQRRYWDDDDDGRS